MVSTRDWNGSATRSERLDTTRKFSVSWMFSYQNRLCSARYDPKQSQIKSPHINQSIKLSGVLPLTLHPKPSIVLEPKHHSIEPQAAGRIGQIHKLYDEMMMDGYQHIHFSFLRSSSRIVLLLLVLWLLAFQASSTSFPCL